MRRQRESTGRRSDRGNRTRQKASNLAEQHGLVEGYRSGLEVRTQLIFQELGIEAEFEGATLEWTPLPIKHKYHPDFRILDKEGEPHITKAGKILIIETKGRFMPEDMQKQLALKLQHPEVDIRFIFTNAAKWYRRAKTMSYAKWCEKHGFQYCSFGEAKDVIPKWMKD